METLEARRLLAADIWLNEFHYDNSGSDEGEFVEVAGAAGTDLAGASIVLYNGSNGTAYNTTTLSGTIDDEDSGVGAVSFEISGIQNGAPDGIALIDADGTIIEFISYEGSFDATDGPAAGMTSTDTIAFEAGNTPIGQSIQRARNEVGTEWSGPIVATPGTLNTDEVAPPELEISIDNPSLTEGDEGTTAFEFTLTRSGDISSPDEVEYAVSSTQADAADFGGTLPSGTLMFEANEASITLAIEVTGDTDVEADEEFTVTISDAGTATIITNTATATIRDDDDPSLTTPIDIWLNEFHYDNDGGDEGEFIEIAGAAGLNVAGATIVLYNGSNASMYRTIELSGTIDDEGTGVGALSFDASGIQNGPDAIALINKDDSVIEFISYEGSFTATDGPANGETSVDVGVAEPGSTPIGESLQRLANTAASNWDGPLLASPGTLNSGTAAQPVLSVFAVDTIQDEGNSGTTPFEFTVTRSGDRTTSVSVDYAVSSVDADAADFGGTLPSGTVSFGADESTMTVIIDVSGDTDIEPGETFTVALSNAVGATIGIDSADATIRDDDDTNVGKPIDIWLNEFHYDNDGGDVDEFVEIAGAAGTDVSEASIALYNGSNGTAYSIIPLSGTIDDEGGGFGALSFDAGLQNGPDAIALINGDGSIIEFISYEGAFTATDGPANGETSVDIGVSEPGTTPIGESLQREDDSANGAWIGPAASSAGSLNAGGMMVTDPCDAPDLAAFLAAQNTVSGDANLDGLVNALDLNEVGINWQQAGPEFSWAQGDFTCDGTIDASDLNEVGINWQFGVAAPAAVYQPRIVVVNEMGAVEVDRGPNTKPVLPAATGVETPRENELPRANRAIDRQMNQVRRARPQVALNQVALNQGAVDELFRDLGT